MEAEFVGDGAVAFKLGPGLVPDFTAEFPRAPGVFCVPAMLDPDEDKTF